MAAIYGQLIKAQFESSASDLSTTSTGLVYYNTASNVVKYYNASAWRTIANLEANQTFAGVITMASPVINTGVSGTAILDEDDMASDSATKLATQQSIKAYVDNKVATSLVGDYHLVSSADYTVLDNDGYTVIGVSTSSTTRTITLPTASANDNRSITITKVDNGTGSVIIDGEGAETIGGQATINLAFLNDSVTIICDGSNWQFKGPVYSSTIVDLTSGTTNFTGGTIRCVRIGNVVTVTGISTPTHASASSATATAAIPSFYRPTTTTQNTYSDGATTVRLVTIGSSGDFSTTYRDWAGSTSAQTDAGSIATLSYVVG